MITLRLNAMFWMAIGLLCSCSPWTLPSNKNEVQKSTEGGRAKQTAEKHRRPAEHTIPNPMRLWLPSDEAFLGTPLPQGDPSRYQHWKMQDTIRVGKSHLQELEIINDGKLAVVVSGIENTIRVYDRSSKKLVANHPVPNAAPMESLAVTDWPLGDPPSHFVLSNAAGLWLGNVTDGGLKSLARSASSAIIRWSPDNKILVTSTANLEEQSSSLNFLKLSDSNDQPLQFLGVIFLEERVDSWDLSPDNRFLAMAFYPSNLVELWDLHTGRILWSIPGPKYAGYVSISPNGKSVAIGGASLLVVDSMDPSIRAGYSDFKNNISQVRFSPSGDALFAASYDGKIRIFQLSPSKKKLELKKTLSHSGSANVYTLRFIDKGWGLASSSGDRTIRFWGAGAKSSVDRMSNGDLWQPLEPPSGPAQTPPPIDPASLSDAQRQELLETLQNAPRHRPVLLDEAPRPSGIEPGGYDCKVSREYRFRDCVVVRQPAGHTTLEIKEGNLIAFKGVLYDDGPVVRFEGWPTDNEPFGCDACRPHCIRNPRDCGCPPGSIERTLSCLGQPVHAVFRRKGKVWKGIIRFFDHYDKANPPELPSKHFKFEGNNHQYVVVLKKRQSD